MSTLFLSDLHLSPLRPEITALFESFMAGPARSAERVLILGDLFEYWAGDDDLDDYFNRRVVSALKACARSVPLFFMRGNRDFLVDSGFSSATGAALLDDPYVMDLYGVRTLVMHGDSLCTDDLEYQRFRNEVRAQAWIDRFLAEPIATRKTRIEALRVRSESEKRVKTMAIMDVNPEAVETAMRANHCHRLIHGHTHRPAVHRFDLDGLPAERWVLSDWYQDGHYLICDKEGLHTRRIPPGP